MAPADRIGLGEVADADHSMMISGAIARICNSAKKVSVLAIAMT